MSHTLQKSEHSPQASDAALLDRLTERTDALGGVGAVERMIDSTKRVVVQTAARISPLVSMCGMT